MGNITSGKIDNSHVIYLNGAHTKSPVTKCFSCLRLLLLLYLLYIGTFTLCCAYRPLKDAPENYTTSDMDKTIRVQKTLDVCEICKWDISLLLMLWWLYTVGEYYQLNIYIRYFKTQILFGWGNFHFYQNNIFSRYLHFSLSLTFGYIWHRTVKYLNKYPILRL